MQERDAYFMGLALEQARTAQTQEEVPVGAVVVYGDTVVGVGFNRVIADQDPSAHAEVVALRAAARTLHNYRLDACELYVTLEPCLMCWGMVQHSRIRRLVYGASDSHRAAAEAAPCGEAVEVATVRHPRLPGAPACRMEGGCREGECAALLQGFFQQRRHAHAQDKEPLREDALRADGRAREQLVGIGWQAQGRYVSPPLPALRGLRLHVWEWGASVDSTKPSLQVFLHGHGTWALQFYALLRKVEAPHQDMLLVDRPGHGWSDKSKKGWEHDPCIQQDAMAELLRRYPHAQVDLVAHDGAAALAWHLAHCDPRVRSLTLLNPCLYAQMLSAPREKTGRAPQSWARITTLAGLQRWRSQQPDGATGDALLWPLPDDGHIAGWSRYLRTIAAAGAPAPPIQAGAVLGGLLSPHLRILCNPSYRHQAEAFCKVYGISSAETAIEVCDEAAAPVDWLAAGR